MNILIVGFGYVGQHVYDTIKDLKPDIYDKYIEKYSVKKQITYDITFICVPTPQTQYESCDISEVENAIIENASKLYVIKSTILPGTTERLSKKYSKDIIFSPEYVGQSQHSRNYTFDFTILGGEKSLCAKVIQMYGLVYDGRAKYTITDSKTAELAKYMHNAFMGMKMLFSAQFWEIAKSLGIYYEELREIFILDPRINPDRTLVLDDEPYYNSHCLNKDIPAIADFSKGKLLESLVAYNEYLQKESKDF